MKEITLTLGTIAAEFGMTRDVLRRILSENSVSPVARRGGHPVYRLGDAFRAATADADPEHMSPHARLALARAIQTEDAIRVRRGELMERFDCERGMVAMAMTLTRWAETSVDVLERDASLTAQQVAVMESTLDRLRDELADQIAGDESADEAAE